MQDIITKQFPNWGFHHNYNEACNRRIWVLWNGDFKVNLVVISSQSITCFIEATQKFFFSAIYESNNAEEKRDLWSHLIELQSSVQNNPWMMAGDFNVIAGIEESSSIAKQGVINNDIREFADVRIQLSMLDHHYNGPLFTWTNKQEKGFEARKLDRVFINDIWLNNCSISSVEFLSPEVSDHCPALIKFQQEVASPPKPITFFNYWTKHHQFLQIVEESWKEVVTGCPMNVLHNKLKRVKAKLRAFNKAYFGGISLRIADKKKELAKTQMAVLNFPNDSTLIELENNLSYELQDLLLVEASFYRQKSRIE
ncbi:hypothetical protein DITRI_Ditri02bG0065800 [Diplodiscus trichospermus]